MTSIGTPARPKMFTNKADIKYYQFSASYIKEEEKVNVIMLGEKNYFK